MMSDDALMLANKRDGKYFWTKSKIYDLEWKIPVLNIPIFRLLNTIIVIYSIAIGVDFIVGLCTEGSRLILAVSLIGASLYWLWATWWDEPCFAPPTWTGLKAQQFNAFWNITWLAYHAMLVGFAFFVGMSTLVVNYADLREIFKWECWGDSLEE
jgi:hypothetical protein